MGNQSVDPTEVWEEKIDKLIDNYNEMNDYLFRRDYVQWSQEAEDKAVHDYFELREEILNRLVNL
jgi:hypothetical protein